MRWVFTPDEYAHVWRETGLDRYPAPLLVVETAQTADAARVNRAAAEARYPSRADPELSVALRITATPGTRVQILASAVRIAGCVVNRSAAVTVQRPDRFEVSLVGSGALASALVDAIAPNGPGREPARATSYANLSGDAAPAVLIDAAAAPVAGPMRTLLAAPRSGSGHIGVQRFLDHDVPQRPRHAGWIDVAGDGRYLVRRGADIEIVPASPAVLRAELDRMLGRRHDPRR